MARKQKEIKVVVEFTPGYRERFTKACVEVAKDFVEKKWAEEKAQKEKEGATA